VDHIHVFKREQTVFLRMTWMHSKTNMVETATRAHIFSFCLHTQICSVSFEQNNSRYNTIISVIASSQNPLSYSQTSMRAAERRPPLNLCGYPKRHLPSQHITREYSIPKIRRMESSLKQANKNAHT
jgi:hypothetical protein